MTGGVVKEKKKSLRKEILAARYVDRLTAPASEGCIEIEQPWERTHLVTQKEIQRTLDDKTSKSLFRKEIDYSSATVVDYSACGRYYAVGTNKGCLQLYDTQKRGTDPLMKTSTLEQIKDVKVCYNENAIAIAMRNSVAVYDKQGVQVHNFNAEKEAVVLDYLPHHMLLVSASERRGELRWRDLSTGDFAAIHKLKSQSGAAMKHNEYNGVVYTGSKSGLVSLWEPKLKTPALQFLGTNRSPVTGLLPFSNHYVITASGANVVAVYDIRNPQTAVNRITLPSIGPVSLGLSGRSKVAIAQGASVSVWSDLHSSSFTSANRYISHRYDDGTHITDVAFQPFYDTLTLGLDTGFEHIMVPGCGIACVDYLVDNPYANRKAAAEALVHKLLDKLPADMIMIDPTQFAQQFAS